MNKEKVLELRETGLSYGEISKMLDMPHVAQSSQLLKEAKNQDVSTVAKGSIKNLDTIV